LRRFDTTTLKEAAAIATRTRALSNSMVERSGVELCRGCARRDRTVRSAEAGLLRKRVVKRLVKEGGKRSPLRGKARVWSGFETREGFDWRESLHCAAVITGEKEVDFSSGEFSTIIIGPHTWARQRSLDRRWRALARLAVAAPSSWKQSGKGGGSLRVGQKPKFPDTQKPSGSRCNRKRRKNSSSNRVINFCSFGCAWKCANERDLPISKRD